MRDIRSNGDNKEKDCTDGRSTEEHSAKGSRTTTGPSGYGIVHTWGDADRGACVSSMERVEASDSQILITRKNGMIEIVDIDQRDGFSQAWQQKVRGVPVSAHAMVDSTRDSFPVSVFMEDGKGIIYDYRNQGGDNEPVAEFSCPPSLTCTAHHAGSRRFAVGCQGAELKVYQASDLDGKISSAIFSAKGGKPNSVGLCDRAWNSAVAFNHGQDDGSQIIVGTGYGKMRLYDTKVGRRPQMDIPFKEYRISCLVPERCGNRWWVGDASGNLQVYDVRAGKYSGAIKGIGGSIRSLDIHPQESLIASAGLDRFIRVNSISSRTSLVKLYATSQLTAVRFLPLESVESPREDSKQKKEPANKQLPRIDSNGAKRQRKR